MQIELNRNLGTFIVFWGRNLCLKMVSVVRRASQPLKGGQQSRPVANTLSEHPLVMPQVLPIKSLFAHISYSPK
jgi:hypothetical protein